MPGSVDCADYLTRVMTLAQLASPIMDELMTSIIRHRVDGDRGQAIAAMTLEVANYLVEVVEDGSAVVLMVAMAREGEDLLLAMAVNGPVRPVGGAAATAGLARAGEIARALGGDLERGVADGRMVVGLRLPWAAYENGGRG